MWKEIISRGFITYCIWGVCGLGILGKLLAHLGYAHYARVTGKIPETRNKLMKKMKMKFESCYKLNLGVNNIGLFVDKQLLWLSHPKYNHIFNNGRRRNTGRRGGKRLAGCGV